MHEIDPESLYQQIIDTASADGIITSDEQAMLTNVKTNIDTYFEILEQSYEDNYISADEQNEMHMFRKKILEEVIEVAKEDDSITQDEYNLLQTIRQVLEEMKEHEHY